MAQNGSKAVINLFVFKIASIKSSFNKIENLASYNLVKKVMKMK
jgi:hypothetical protein